MWVVCYHLCPILPKIIVREIALFANPLIVNESDDPNILHYARSKGFLTINLNLSLVEAAKKNQIKKIKYLIGQGAGVNYSLGQALRVCFDKGHLDAFKFIHFAGANIYSLNNYVFIYPTSLEFFKYLIKIDAEEVFNNIFVHDFAFIFEFLHIHPQFFETFKKRAVINNKIEILQKIPINDKNDLLNLAFNYDAFKSIKYLILNGADINIQGDSILHKYIALGDLNMIEFLLENKIKITSITTNWYNFTYSVTTPVKIINLLVKHNVDFNLLDDIKISNIILGRHGKNSSLQLLHVALSVLYSDFETFKIIHTRYSNKNETFRNVRINYLYSDKDMMLNYAAQNFEKFAFLFNEYKPTIQREYQGWKVEDLFKIYNEKPQNRFPKPPKNK